MHGMCVADLLCALWRLAQRVSDALAEPYRGHHARLRLRVDPCDGKQLGAPHTSGAVCHRVAFRRALITLHHRLLCRRRRTSPWARQPPPRPRARDSTLQTCATFYPLSATKPPSHQGHARRGRPTRRQLCCCACAGGDPSEQRGRAPRLRRRDACRADRTATSSRHAQVRPPAPTHVEEIDR